MVFCVVDMLDVKHHKIRYFHKTFYLGVDFTVRICRKEDTGGIKTGVNAFFFGFRKEFYEEIHLYHRLSAGGSNATGTVKASIAFKTRKNLIGTHLLAVFEMPTVGIVTVKTSHRTALEKDYKTNAWPIYGAEGFQRMNASHIRFFRGKYGRLLHPDAVWKA